jgi:hypothetical protein
VDSSGSAYVTGFTNLINFPQVNSLQGPSSPFSALQSHRRHDLQSYSFGYGGERFAERLSRSG